MVLEGFAALPFLCMGSLLVLLDTLLQANLPLVVTAVGMPKSHAMGVTEGQPQRRHHRIPALLLRWGRQLR